MPDFSRSAVLLLASVQAFTNAVALATKPTTCELASETSIQEVYKGFGIFYWFIRMPKTSEMNTI